MPSSDREDAIAIIGMACRVAGANSPSELWHLLATSKDVQSEITRFNTEGFYHPDGGPRKGLTNVTRAYMMPDDAIDRFDNAFFQTTLMEAVAMDPQQRMLLEICYEAVESAGIPLDKFSGTDTAVYAGMDSCDYHTILARDIDNTPTYLATGTAGCMAANRLSYFFNLSGPSMACDTACSSTMAAVHQATRTLQNGDAGMAIVCGAKLILSPDMFVPSSELGFLSPSGRCRSFDAAGDGYGRGEGALALLLKPLKQAVRDNDPIRAVIRGTRLNQDGRTQGITLPSSTAQKENMHTLYSQLKLSSSEIQYVEAHGTGTAAGDPLEFGAINLVYGAEDRKRSLVVGSIKSNIGHLESSAGLASIIKTVVCLENGQIPPQMHFVNPHPRIDFNRVEIPVKTISWPESASEVRRAAVNTFGAGGTNGHAVLESYVRSKSEHQPTETCLLFKVSAADEATLARQAAKYAEYIDNTETDIHDLAYTLLDRRSTLQKSYFFTAKTKADVIEGLRAVTYRIVSKWGESGQGMLFLFTGQGAQWPRMGKALLDGSPLFKATIHECETVLASLSDKPKWSIEEELSKEEKASNVYQASYSQPLCTAIQIGLVRLWASWGISPTAVVGHSSGEIGAAFAAGFLSLRDAMLVSFYRGLSLSQGHSNGFVQPKIQGSMCAVAMDENEVESLITPYDGRIQIAAVNSGNSCTLSGDRSAIKQVVSRCTKEGIFCRELKVDMAYHSDHMLPMAGLYEQFLRKADLSLCNGNSSCRMFSSVTGAKLDSESCQPSYWVQNMVSTVRFSAALKSCLDSNPDINRVLEVGPHPALQSPALEVLRSAEKTENCAYFHSCVRGKNDYETMLLSAGSMMAHGLPVRTSAVNQISPTGRNVLTDLPSYQWDHSTSFWAESRLSQNLRFRQFPRHQLLGSRYLEDTALCPSWRNLLMLKEVLWLMEMKTDGIPDAPSAMFLLMALEAARQVSRAQELRADQARLNDIYFYEPLALDRFKTPSTTVELHFNARQNAGDDTFQFEISSYCSQSGSMRHCHGAFSCTVSEPAPVKMDSSIISPDTFLLKAANIIVRRLSQTAFPKLGDIFLNEHGSQGSFVNSQEQHENYCIDPVVLSSVVTLMPLSGVRRNLPTMQRLSFIKAMFAPLSPAETPSGTFQTSYHPMDPCGSMCDAKIIVDGRNLILSGVSYEAMRPIRLEPQLESLLFKPVLMADLTMANPAKPLSLQSLLDLVSHKWPMCDVGFDNMSDELSTSTCANIERLLSGRRRGLRSLELCDTVNGYVIDDDQHARTSSISQFHLLILGKIENVTNTVQRLHPHGLACVRTSDSECLTKLKSCMDMICPVEGINDDTWTLWRMQGISRVMADTENIIIFVSDEDKQWLPGKIRSAKSIALVNDVAPQYSNPSDIKKDAIVVDTAKTAVLTSWPGSKLILWLRTLLQSSRSLLWVTLDHSGSLSAKTPFTDIAGSLLRTLQAEQPALKISWLRFRETNRLSLAKVQDHILQAYNVMLNGDNEVLREVRDGCVNVLRFVPDDGLSAAVGAIPPQPVSGPDSGRNYEISLAAPHTPVILAHRRQSRRKGFDTENDLVELEVEASVIDQSDVSAYLGSRQSGHYRKLIGQDSLQASRGLGLFFAGRILSDHSKTFADGVGVVGWQPGAHRGYLRVSSSRIQLSNRENNAPISAAKAAAYFGAFATAVCIVDGVARLRKDDTIRVNLDGILAEAVTRECHKIGAIVLDHDGTRAAGFVVSVNQSGAICVDNKPISIRGYLESDHGSSAISQAWTTCRPYETNLNLHDLVNLKRAFEASIKCPWSTVLVHSGRDRVASTVPVYRKPSSLFSSTGAYVIIGGLGGLGRFVCAWMVENGAKTIYAISRRGLKSAEAQDAYTAINKSCASLEVLKADACDQKAMAETLTRIRKRHAIIGVMNMAMLLGDAPFMDMTGDEWDRALRLKVDSSWILHQETLDDPLDFFILFSSIASVLGNRNQAGYNVGNAFLNALAEYRRGQGRTAISIALGAMTDAGVLHELGRENLAQYLSRSGLANLRKPDLAKILEAAILESSNPNRSFLLTGLEMFERVDGKIVGNQDQMQLYWTELPEFGHLQSHRKSDKIGNGNEGMGLRESLGKLNDEEWAGMLQGRFLGFLSTLLGFAKESFDGKARLGAYGLDSLSAVSCQYWFHRELEIDISVGEVLNTPSIASLLDVAQIKAKSQHK